MRGAGGQRPYINFTCKVGAHVVCPARACHVYVYMHHKIDDDLRGGGGSGGDGNGNVCNATRVYHCKLMYALPLPLARQLALT